MADMMKDGELIDFGFSATEKAQLDVYHRLLVEWNERMNLTGITAYDEVYVKHFLDSVLIRKLPEFDNLIRQRGRVIDVGTGAGFPGLPLAICYPMMEFVLCDSLQKRLTFLAEVVNQLGLKNVTLVHGRAEDLGQNPNFRGQFDAVVSRAVARLNLLMELVCPFLVRGGVAFCYKGPQVVEEMPDALRAAKVLKSEIGELVVYDLPSAAGSRTIVPILQRGMMSKIYPRKAGVPQKNPL